MKQRVFLMVLMALVLSAITAFAGDINGKWAAEVQGRDGNKMVQTFTLKQDGDKLTGSVSSPRGDREISDGKVSGDEISFSLKFEMNGETRTIPYTGKVSGNEIKFKSGTGDRVREFTAKRSES
jgi:hypothetical protein